MPKPDLTSETILDALRDIEDPEIGTNIVDLGLIYDVTIREDRAVGVKMTTTTRFCPASAFLADAVKACIEALEGVSQATVELVYEPAWSPEMAELFSLGPSPNEEQMMADQIDIKDFTVDADLIASRFGVPTETLRRQMLQGLVHSVVERGESEDAGRTRLTVRIGNRSWIAVVADDGTRISERMAFCAMK